MRNAIEIDNQFVVTSDNSGGIGEKVQDVVAVPDRLTAYYAARVTLLEQWAAHANPMLTIIHNFSGRNSWEEYVHGVTDLVREARLDAVKISGSTETNMEMLQSALGITMIGKRRESVETQAGQWFIYGVPLVGDEVIHHPQQVASIRKIKDAMDAGAITRIWPVGSKGILHEVQALFADQTIQIQSRLDVHKAAGPSTAVLIQVPSPRIEEVKQLVGNVLEKVRSER